MQLRARARAPAGSGLGGANRCHRGGGVDAPSRAGADPVTVNLTGVDRHNAGHAFSAGSASRGRSRDCDQVAKHALSRELGAGAGSDDRDLSDRTRAAYQSVGGPVDVGQRIGAANELGLDTSSDIPGSVWLREVERRDVLESRLAGSGPLDLRAGDIGDSAAADLLASKLSAEDER